MATLSSKEFYDLIATFEASIKGRTNNYGYLPSDFTKESKDLWPKGYVYTNGTVNSAFRIFHSGYELGKSVSNQQEMSY